MQISKLVPCVYGKFEVFKIYLEISGMGGMKSREEKDFKGRREGKIGMESCRGRRGKEEKIGGRELLSQPSFNPNPLLN